MAIRKVGQISKLEVDSSKQLDSQLIEKMKIKKYQTLDL
jgi:hypothetical protein